MFRPRMLRFASLRSKLFAAFVGVLILSLLLTATVFFLEIRLLDRQQVKTDLKATAPAVYIGVKRSIERYWQSPQPDLTRLTADLVVKARAAHVRILLTNYCNQDAIDTSSPALPQAQAIAPTCSPNIPVIQVQPSRDLVLQTALPGAPQSYYLAYAAPYIPQYANATPLLVRTIIIAMSLDGVDQGAFGRLVPPLAAAGALAVVLSLLVVLLIVRAITRPLRTITAASERMASGDYDQRVAEVGEDEVGQLARSFNRMATEVRDAREHQRQFIANVSHDLKTPLTSILGFSQILADSDGVAADPTERRAVQVINEEARRLQRLTLDLLDLSRLEAGQLHLSHQPCDLNDLAGRTLARYADLPANAALSFVDRRMRDPLWVLGDADRLTQVLVNLLDNAVKFCDPSGTIEISTARHGAEALLSIANTGVGIDTEDLTRVFQRFYRTDHSRATRTGGTGLGLPIVREIVGAHGGRVEAQSEINGWTRFTVTLSALRAPATPTSVRSG